LNYTEQFFTLALANQDTTGIINELASSNEALGGNKTITLKIFTSLRSLLSNLSSTPTASQQTIIKQSMIEVLNSSKALIISLPGMANFENDTNLRTSPQNVKFYQIYNQLLKDSLGIIASPASADAYFRNQTVAKLLGELSVLSIHASTNSSSCKYSYEK
jgi:hypothetical protein